VYAWWVFVHILGGFAFLLGHGVSVAMAIALRRERDPQRIQALLGLSRIYLGVTYASLLVLLIGGIVAGFLGHWWGQGWIWTALGFLVALWVGMSLLGTSFYDRVRIAVGTEPLYGARKKAWLQERPPPATSAELDALLSSNRPFQLAWMGVIGLVLILWLMVLKPF
jgi:MFS family permease